ncbi:MAG: oxalate/formate MFS antiporter [Ferrovum sp. 21-44-67]|uniref:oxalate/formate MFS antiporter n=1 Tax=Ferrovum sp. JA12 TaxID=1356299 RepID=UPI000703B529|nr:oxalate/formate MFS antiporter [Ferrovum sp. JA12]KRH78063.1 oxalate:formate antiporter [Ferrovum sp. JA12]OYV79764.1 MAG: oxalate/formate MFS antiporter [Ferrovum sp. 21-44-67]
MSRSVVQPSVSLTEPFTGPTRWVQLVLGLVCMMAIASPQYTWTLFTKPLMGSIGAKLPEIQITFSILIVIQTFFSPIQGYFIDRFGPRFLISVGTFLSGLSWVMASYIHTLTGLYLTYGLIGGVGTGIVYIGIISQMVKWFPDRRGFAVGMVAAGYGFGAFLTTFPVAYGISHYGYQMTLFVYGILFAIIGVIAAQGLKQPFTPTTPATSVTEPEVRGVSGKVMLKTPLFWLMFIMMTMLSTSGLMVISQTAAIARDFGVASVLVFGMAALPLALSVDRITNGLTRPFFGWMSDRIGRENTMFIAFLMEGLAMLAWLQFRGDPLLFVLLTGVVFFGWGEIFSLFPSTLTDTFGEKYASSNYGLLYMAQGVGSVLGGPVAAQLHEVTHSWLPVFAVVITLDIVAALLALFVLKPLRRKVRYC